MTVQVTSHSFGSIHEEWEGLLPSCAVNTLFITPLWQRLWWEVFNKDQEPLLLAFHQGAEALGIAPLMRQEETLALLGDPDLFDYQDFVVPRSQESAFFSALVEYLDAKEWARLELPSLREDSQTLVHLPGLAQGRGWDCRVEEQDVSPGLGLPGDWDAYLSTLAKKHRHELRRKFRRLHATVQSQHDICLNPATIQRCLEDLFMLMRLGREEKRSFLTPDREEFFRVIASELAEAGLLNLYFLDIEGERVAACLCFDYDGQRLLYNSGFNPEHSQLSVGLLLKATCLEDAISADMQYFDFLRGDEPYKYHLGGVDRRVYRMVVSR